MARGGEGGELADERTSCWRAVSASARRELASFLLEERAVEDLMGSLAF